MQEAWTRVGDRLVRSWSTGELGRWTRATVLDLPGWRRGRGQASPSTVEGWRPARRAG